MLEIDLVTRLGLALEIRSKLIDEGQNTALRLLAGFYEGCPNLVADLYGRTLILYDYHHNNQLGESNLKLAQDFYLTQFPWIDCVIHKIRHAPDLERRQGVVTYGIDPASNISEHGITYALDLLVNQDASFYLDTRSVRGWLLKKAANWRVLNTFAYTGSLGIAALAAGAAYVIQTDRSKKFLALARKSAMQNRLDLGKMKLRSDDFFSEVARLKRKSDLFDCVILDPPFFSSTPKGTVELANQNTRLINKVRPLIRDGGYLIAINNALFLSGREYLKSLEVLCQDGYLDIERTIQVPVDITGFPETIINQPPTDPEPFNHSTKIVLMRIRRKK